MYKMSVIEKVIAEEILSDVSSVEEIKALAARRIGNSPQFHNKFLVELEKMFVARVGKSKVISSLAKE